MAKFLFRSPSLALSALRYIIEICNANVTNSPRKMVENPRKKIWLRWWIIFTIQCSSTIHTMKNTFYKMHTTPAFWLCQQTFQQSWEKLCVCISNFYQRKKKNGEKRFSLTKHSLLYNKYSKQKEICNVGNLIMLFELTFPKKVKKINMHIWVIKKGWNECSAKGREQHVSRVLQGSDQSQAKPNQTSNKKIWHKRKLQNKTDVLFVKREKVTQLYNKWTWSFIAKMSV